MKYQHFSRVVRYCALPALLTLTMVITSAKSYAQKGTADTTVYTKVDVLPEFPGGVDGFMKFMRTNLRYPAEAKKQKVQGRVNVNFVVERDGSLSNVKAVGRPNALLTDEALRTVKASPRWTPGKQNGKTVRTMYTVPVMFSL